MSGLRQSRDAAVHQQFFRTQKYREIERRYASYNPHPQTIGKDVSTKYQAMPRCETEHQRDFYARMSRPRSQQLAERYQAKFERSRVSDGAGCDYDQ